VRIAIAAAGTGGHVYPALAVAAALEERGLGRTDVFFLGGDRIEAQAIPAAGYRFVGYELTKLRRSLTLENLRIPVVVRRAAIAMAHELRRSDAAAVLGMVGYVTVPAALAARRAGIPFVVHEQNAAPTLAARFGARRARLTLLGLPGRSQLLPRSEVVGNPLRPTLAAFDRAALRPAARARYGLPAEGPVVGILGGSLGARALNEAAGALVAAVGCPVLHLTGHQAAGLGDQTDGSLPWIRIPYESEMQDFYAAVDVVVCRAGAMTVSELAATGTPAVLVPLERVGQSANAAVIATAGGAVVVPQDRISHLTGVVAGLVGDPAARAGMAAAAFRISRPDAARTVAARLLEVAGG
jgi:UDP-N-acetylglucosamine--N-acetylmuramyl-(pentapeptide) pyrophosphoryl-undecaprenol N-acetylglucosamine transferase